MITSRRDHEKTKLSKDHEEELVFFVLFVGFRVFVVAFVLVGQAHCRPSRMDASAMTTSAKAVSASRSEP